MIYLKLVNISVPISYLMGNRKWVKNVVDKAVKLSSEARGNSIYHFVAGPVSVHWKRHSLTESSFKELDEHHK